MTHLVLGLIADNELDRININPFFSIHSKAKIQQSISQNHGTILIKYYLMDENDQIFKPDLYSNIVLNPFHLSWYFLQNYYSKKTVTI
ncbi:unnamed protein product, partial [Trifolium pratense]